MSHLLQTILVLPKWLISYWYTKTNKFTKISIKIGLFVACFSLSRRIYFALYRKYYNLPYGPIGIPFFGQLFAMNKNRDKYFKDYISKFGPTTMIHTGLTSHIVINDPLIARNILLNRQYIANDIHYLRFFKDNNNAFGTVGIDKMHIIYGDQLNTKNIEIGVKDGLKSIIFPIFNQSSVAIEIRPLIRKFVYSLMHHAVLGFHIRDDEFIEEFHSVTQKAINRGVKGWIKQLLLKIKPTQSINDIDHHIYKEGIQYIEKYIFKHKEIILNKNNNSFYSKIYQRFVITNEMDEISLTLMMIFVIISAVGGIAFTMERALIVLCKYKNIEKLLYEEICDVFDIDKNKSEYVELDNFYDKILGKKLNKLQSFIYETLRLYPSTAQTNFREVVDDEGIIIDGYNIPKGFTFFLNVHAINKNKKYWKNANEFDLRNFLNDKTHQFEKNKSFVTFGIGRHTCVGNNLALKQLYLLMAQIIVNYKVSIDGEFDINYFDNKVKYDVNFTKRFQTL